MGDNGVGVMEPAVETPQNMVRIILEPLKPDVNKKVAIVGTSHSWDMAPFDDPSTEIWGVNNGFIQIGKRRKSRWFDTHYIEHRTEEHGYPRWDQDEEGNRVFVRADGHWYRRWKREFRGQQVEQYVECLKSLGCPVYMQHTWPEIPNSMEFPIDKIKGYFGTYITNSISMQLAYALSENFGDIQLFGIDMSAGTEWAYQRPNAEFFLGIAITLGARLLIPPESDLLKSAFMYAYGERDKSKWIKKSEILERKITEKMEKTSMEILRLEKELEFRRKTLEQYIGSKQGVKEMKSQWVNDLGHWHYPE